MIILIGARKPLIHDFKKMFSKEEIKLNKRTIQLQF